MGVGCRDERNLTQRDPINIKRFTQCFTGESPRNGYYKRQILRRGSNEWIVKDE